MEPLETLSEHVSNPNGPVCLKMSYRCSDAACPTREADIVWNEDGERYGGFSFPKSRFIADNDAPFGTMSRRINVEVSKCGVPDKKKLFAIGDILFQKEFHYRADNNGKVIRKTWKVVTWKKDGNGWMSYSFPVMDFLFWVKHGIERGWALSRKGRKPRWGMDIMCFCIEKRENRWWRLWSVRVNRVLFPFLTKGIPFRQE